MLPQPDINDLARQAKDGDELAFEELARIVTPTLIGFFMRKGGCDAEELTQQTWLHIVGGFATYNPERDFKTWLFSIAFYRWADWGRSNQRQPGPIVEEIPASSMSDPVSSEEFVAALRDCIKELTELERTIIFLRYWDNLELKEVAERIDLPYASVKGKVHRARENLDKCLGGKFL